MDVPTYMDLPLSIEPICLHLLAQLGNHLLSKDASHRREVKALPEHTHARSTILVRDVQQLAAGHSRHVAVSAPLRLGCLRDLPQRKGPVEAFLRVPGARVFRLLPVGVLVVCELEPHARARGKVEVRRARRG